MADTEHVTRTLKVGRDATLWLNSFSGRVAIVGSDEPDVTIDATRHGTRNQLDRVRLDIQSDGSRVRIDANQHDTWWFFWGRYDAVETDFDIKVPRRTNLTIKLFSASLDVQGVQGSHNIETFSSYAKLDGVTGPIRGQSFSGPFEIRAAAWRDDQSIVIDTFSGSIDLRLPPAANGTVEFDSFSGHLSSSSPLLFESGRRNRFTGRLGPVSASNAGGAGSVRVHTFSGNLTIDH